MLCWEKSRMGLEGKVDKKKKKTTAKCRSSRTLVRAGRKINYEILIQAFNEIFKSLSCWSSDIIIILQLKLNTSKDGAICKTPSTCLQCTAGFCKNSHSIARYMTCNHLIAGSLTWSLTITGTCHCWCSLEVISEMEASWWVCSFGFQNC